MFCHQCGAKINEDSVFCKKCGANQDENQVVEKKPTKPSKRQVKKLEGFSGWLLLLGLGIFLTPAFMAFGLFSELEYAGFNFFTIITLAIIGLFVWLNYLMFKRRKVFKKWFFITMIVYVIYAGLIALLVSAAIDPSVTGDYAITEADAQDIYSEFGRAVLYLIVWGLYVWQSKRVKNTFIY